MDELEDRVTRMLAARAERAPELDGLAGRARTRHRHRRTARAVVAGGAVAVAVLAVPLALQLGDASDAPGVAGRPEASASAVPDGWRFESYRNVELAVPPDWRHGSLEDWCANGGRPSPGVVERPGGVVRAIGCPTSAYGVRFGPAPANPPAGAVVMDTELAGQTISVVAEDVRTAATVIESVREISGEDANGCQPSRSVPPLGQAAGTPSGHGDSATLCHYTVGVDGPALASSELLSGDDAERLWRALDAAQPGTGPDSGRSSCIDSPETDAVLVKRGGAAYAWVHYTGCSGHGIDVVGDTTYELDERVLYWTLPRGSFALDGSVPVPDRLRP